MDRPRRALLEEPDNVESYVAKRSLGFTQADSGDNIVVRRARAARALEPSGIGTQAQTADRDRPGFSGPPRPRRASLTEPSSWDLEEEKVTPTAPAAAGRRAIVDLEPSPSGGPVVPSQPTVPLTVRPAAPEPPKHCACATSSAGGRPAQDHCGAAARARFRTGPDSPHDSAS